MTPIDPHSIVSTVQKLIESLVEHCGEAGIWYALYCTTWDYVVTMHVIRSFDTVHSALWHEWSRL